VAQTIATAYVDIMPSTRGLKAALDKEVTPAAKATGANAGRAMGDAISTEVQRTTGPRLRKVMADAAAQGKIGFSTKIKGIGASLVDEFKATGQISGTLRTVNDSFGVTGDRARGLVEKFKTVSGASGGLASGLGGVSSLLMGPWGLAIAGAGLALNGFLQAQQNADEAAKALLDTLDQQSGAFTRASVAQVITALLKDLDKAGDVDRLKAIGINLDEAAAAAIKGGPALEEYQRKLDALLKVAGNNQKSGNPTTTAIVGLQNSLINQREDIDRTRGAWDQYALGQTLTGKAATQLGIVLDDSADKAKGVGTAVRSIPNAWSVTITTNLATVVNDAYAALRALQQVQAAGAQYSAGAALNDYIAGVKSGKYGDPIAAKAAKDAKDAKDAAAKAKAAAAKAASDARKQAAADRAKATAEAKRDRANAAREAAADQLRQDRKAKRDAIKGNIREVVTNARTTALPNVTELAKSAPGIRRQLTKQLDTLKRFRQNLKTLAKRGLPQMFLEQLIAAGLDGAATAAALVRAKDSDFAAIKSLTKSLQNEASALGGDEVKILYGAGVNAAKGLIDGLSSQEKAIEAQVVKIAKGMQKAIRKALGIKSPSKVFEQFGRYTGQGFANGVSKSSVEVNRSVVGMVKIPQRAAAVPPSAGPAGGLQFRDLIVNNPVGQTTDKSATTVLRQAAFLVGG
jgi:hypothetical protein